MNTTNISQTCPLCEKDKYMGKKAKLLYGHLVCRKCSKAFASRRQHAFGVDLIFQLFLLVLLYVILLLFAGILEFVLAALSISPPQFMFVLLIITLVILAALIFFMKDGLFLGSSPGKKIFGVQVVDKTTGKPIGFGASFKRNLPLLIPFVPLIVLFQLHKGERIGDGWANTRVIWGKYKDKVPFAISNVG